jgi:hypothetical protein
MEKATREHETSTGDRATESQVRNLLASGAKVPEIEAVLSKQGCPPERAREIVIQVIEQNLQRAAEQERSHQRAVRQVGLRNIAAGLGIALFGVVLTLLSRLFAEYVSVWYIMGGLVTSGVAVCLHGAYQLLTGSDAD